MKLTHIFLLVALSMLLFGDGCTEKKKTEPSRPNILLLMSDNQSWNHLGSYGDPVIRTPNIDKLAEAGVRFSEAYCAAPSCTPARAAMLTGQEIWRLEEGANLWGTLPAKFRVYTDMLAEAGYFVGFEGKGWGPGNYKAGGWDHNPGGTKYESFEAFLNDLKEDQPFCYWFSSRNPHRPYNEGGSKKSDIDLNAIEVPPYLPDNEDVRGDIADYYAEIEVFDVEVDKFIKQLHEAGLEDNTLIVVCSDNGWQMPRGLANLYDFGTKVPLIITMPAFLKGGRVIDDFVSLNDLAPTFLELAGLPVPDYMTAKSLVGMLKSGKSGVIEPERSFVVTARERHAFCRKNGAGYGGRAIRTKDFLYIRNYDSDRWPAGDPPLFGDVDAHMLHYPCPTKIYILKNRDREDVKQFFELGFDKRPAEELYDLRKDPWQLHNVATDENYQKVMMQLSERLDDYLLRTEDPRATGTPMKWFGAEYFEKPDMHPKPAEFAIKALGLKKEYSYVD